MPKAHASISDTLESTWGERFFWYVASAARIGLTKFRVKPIDADSCLEKSNFPNSAFAAVTLLFGSWLGIFAKSSLSGIIYQSIDFVGNVWR